MKLYSAHIKRILYLSVFFVLVTDSFWGSILVTYQHLLLSWEEIPPHDVPVTDARRRISEEHISNATTKLANNDHLYIHNLDDLESNNNKNDFHPGQQTISGNANNDISESNHININKVQENSTNLVTTVEAKRKPSYATHKKQMNSRNAAANDDDISERNKLQENNNSTSTNMVTVQPSYYDATTTEKSGVVLWNPTHYSANLTRLIARGANFLTAVSGCHMAAWVVRKGAKRVALDCNGISHKAQYLDDGKEKLVQAYDTVYMPVKSLAFFHDQLLPNITVPVIVIAGQFFRL